ncbi:hypothetical protein MalM25_24790 [Planctomycetes bacterium MalM25]|nr:hypothetical protein MalM25_24790 [Planctomycetes bacterium MalM25]
MNCTPLALTAALLFGVASNAQATPMEVYRSSMSHGAGWGINAFGDGDHAATFGYDYSADGVPEAPNSRGGDLATRGVKLEANTDPNSPGASGFMLYPVGQNFTGRYQLRFDAWMNYDAHERINGGSAGTTEFLGGGIGYDNAAADLGVGAQVIATGEGGSGSDWRAFGEGSFLGAADMTAGTRNGFDPHYADFLPGVAPSLAQAQVSHPAGVAGSPGFQWVTFEITTDGAEADVWIEKPGGDRLEITTINDNGAHPFTSDGNVGIYYADLFSSVSSRPDLMFGLVDNVVVTQNPVPEPGALALAVVGLSGLIRNRRR